MSEAQSPTPSKRKGASLAALRPLLPYARRRIGRIVAAFAALMAASLATLVVPYAIREMVDQGFHGGATGSIHSYFALLIVVVGALAIASGMRFYLVMTIGERIVADLRGDFFRHLTTLDQTFYDTEKTGEIVSRLSADTTQLKATFGSSASIALRNVFMFVGAISLMAATSFRLSAYVLVAIPLIVLPLYAAGPHGARAFAAGAGHVGRGHRLRQREPRRRPRHAGVRGGGIHRETLSGRGRRSL